MRISPILFLIISLIVSNCTDSKTHFVLVAEDVTGLQKDSKIYSKGLEIGELEKMELSPKGDVHIQCTLNPKVKLSKDSDFFLKNQGETDNKIISVEPGKSEELLMSGDTLELEGNKPIQLLKDLGEKFNDFFEDISHAVDSDSVVIDLKELNKQLEEL